MTTDDRKRDLIEREALVINYCPEHGDLLDGPRSIRCNEAHTVEDIRRTVQGEPTTPDGWFPFGSHAPYPWVGRMEFSGEKDDTGMPRWERPVQSEPTDAQVLAAVGAFREGSFGNDYIDMHAALLAANEMGA